jgi:hypothetical protein
MAGIRANKRRRAARQHGQLPDSGQASGLAPSGGNRADGLLSPLRQHRGWTVLGVAIAVLAAATRFAAIGILPPSFKVKPFGHANASLEVVIRTPSSFGRGSDPKLQRHLSERTYALADMVSSPEITDYVARAAGLPAPKIGILGPLWWELWRSQQWASGPKRASEIVIEKDPYQITIDQETTLPGLGPGPGPGPPVIDVQTQAASTEIAARLATAVPAALSAYIQHAQAKAGVPVRDRYEVSQLTRVSVAPTKKSQLASVGIFTFFAVLVLWCGAEIAVFGLMRDLRVAADAAKVGHGLDRSSSSGPVVGDPADATI